MARVIWTEPALADLDAIADYIALDNPEAAKALVRNVCRRVEQLTDFHLSGFKPREFKGGGIGNWSSDRAGSSIERMVRVFT